MQRKSLACGTLESMNKLRARLEENEGALGLEVRSEYHYKQQQLDEIPGFSQHNCGIKTTWILTWNLYDAQYPVIHEPRLQFLMGYAACFMSTILPERNK